MNPAEKRLAILVEDHPVEYAEFEGIIPDGNYGAGAVVIWDAGPLEIIDLKEDKIVFALSGRRLKGGFALTKIKRGEKGNEWLLIKRKDEHAGADWKMEIALTPEKRESLKELRPPCETS
jgi:bifunctional non-homologous end joining protein LigD